MFLQSMREKTQSWVAYIIVALLILSFSLWGISSYFSDGQKKAVVAIVDGEKISNTTFLSSFHRFLKDAQVHDGGNYTLEQQHYAQHLVLQSLIERIAVVHYIKKIGFSVNQQQINAALMSVPLFSDHGEFSPALFKRFLMVNSITAQQFISDFSTRMILAQWDEGIRMTSFSTPAELKNIVSLLKQKRTVLYTIIKTNQKVVKPITVADAKRYYNDHKKSYIAPEQVKIDYVILNLSNVMLNSPPTESDLITYYTQNSFRYNVPERWQVSVIRVHSSLSAAEVAQKISAVEAKGLDIVTSIPAAQIEKKTLWLDADNLPINVKNILLKTKINKTTPAFSVGANTYVVYQLLKHQVAVNKQYDEVKNIVKQAYLNQQNNKQWSKMLEEMANLAYEHPDNLSVIAEKFKRKVQSSNFFSRDYDGKVGIESNAEVIAATFSDDVFVAGNNSDVIKLDQGKSALVLRVSSRIAAHQQSFAQVRQAIQQTLENQQAIQSAKEKAESVSQALQDAIPIKKIQQSYGLLLSTVSLGRSSPLLPNEVLQQVFMSPVGHVGVVKMNDNNFAVVKVLAVTPGSMSIVSAKERALYNNVIVNEWAQAELSVYVRSIINNTKVNINHKQLEKNN